MLAAASLLFSLLFSGALLCACVFLQEPLPLLAEAAASLREQISRQEFSAADMEGQLSERTRLRDALAGAGEAKLKARKVCVCVCLSLCVRVCASPLPQQARIVFSISAFQQSKRVKE